VSKGYAVRPQSEQGEHDQGEENPDMRDIEVYDLAIGQVELDELWQYASPTGGYVTSDFWPRFNVETGHVIRVKGVWAVVQDIQRSNAGVWHFITWAGCLCVYSRFDGVQVRTDYRLTVIERPPVVELDDRECIDPEQFEEV
jgi:hypothetical protein